ncbi:MAG: hypothetical protein PHS77_12655 [Gallionellaceae bacterium]|nr:hypothetical protein [Gallionellaceae bacterium]
MKKTLITLATLIAVPLAASSALAMPGQGMRSGPNVEYMARVLDLTPEQQDKVKAMFAEQARKRAEQRAAMRATMQADTQAGMQEILTAEQFAKMNDLRQLRRGGTGPGMGRGLRADCPRR